MNKLKRIAIIYIAFLMLFTSFFSGINIKGVYASDGSIKSRTIINAVKSNNENEVMLMQERGNPESSIRSFDAYYLAGDAVLNEFGQYVLTPPYDYNSYSVTYEVYYSLAGTEDYQPGAIKLRIPAKIFQGRDGTFAANSKTTLPIPAEGASGESDYRYQYDADTDEYIITNINTISSGAEASFQIRYELKKPSLVKDESYTREFVAKLTVNEEQKEKSAGNIQIDTKHGIDRCSKRVYQKYEAYPKTDWGDPSDIDLDNDGDGMADDYFYVVYFIYVKVNLETTQPAMIKIEDLPTNGEVVGYAKSTEYNFSQASIIRSTVTFDSTYEEQFSFYRRLFEYEYGYFVLVRYPRTILNPQDPNSYLIRNKVNVSVTGDDDGITNTVSGSVSYKYIEPQTFTAPPGSTGIAKSGGDYAYGGIQLLMNDKPAIFKSFAGVTGFFETTNTVQKYSLTYQAPDPSDPENGKSDPANYGKIPLRIEVVDDLLYFHDAYDSPLQYGDYEIKRVVVDYSNVTKFKFFTYERDPETLVIEEKQMPYSEYPPIELWYKNEDGGEWIKHGEWYYESYYIRFKKIDGSVISNGKSVEMPVNTYAVKVVAETACYKTELPYRVEVVLNPTDHVKELIERSTPELSSNFPNGVYYLRNVSSLLVYDHEGTMLDTGNNMSGLWVGPTVERDMDLYGQRVGHGFASHYIQDFPTYSTITKSSSYKNDTGSKYVRISYKINAYEELRYNEILSAEEIGDLDVLEEQKAGVFYDLLPKGTILDESSISVSPYIPSSSSWGIAAYKAAMDDYTVGYTYELVDNWRDTGRTLFILRASTPDGVRTYAYKDGYTSARITSGFTVTFDLIYSWNNVADYGTRLLNSVAYQTTSGKLTQGLPDEGGNILEKDLLANLMEGAVTEPNFLFAENNLNLDIVTSTERGLSKRVAKTNTPWTEGRDGSVIVDAGESYSYQLRLGPPQGTMAKDIIFYDALENYQPGTGDVQWRGILTGIDLSQPEYKGADPIVYYSTSDVFKNSSALDLETNRDLTNSELWSTDKPGDASQITAIAIDLSKNNDGEPFILSDKETLSIILHMKAPDDIAQSAIANAKTFNNVYLSNTNIDNYSGETHHVIHAGYTQVGLPDLIEITGTKTWDDADNQDGKRPAKIVVNVKNGATVVKSVELDGTVDENGEVSSWTYKFTGLPKYADGKLIAYTIEETGYEPYTSAKISQPEMEEDVNSYTVDLTNSYTPATTSKTVNKAWDDNNNQDGLRVDVTLQLVAKVDGKEIPWATLVAASASGADMDEDGLVTLTGKKDESHTFENLPVKYQGKDIVYTVVEPTVPTGYTKSYDQDNLTVTNTHTPATINVSVKKIWDDAENQDGKRPAEITINLYKQVGEAEPTLVESKTVKAKDDW
ncbi:MAG: Cna B-type domain-containing protein, partial [Erysipelotrichia bacterium]|nr:Cna B-type domain-containing protein [Erysipelotrichia bacterium]